MPTLILKHDCQNGMCASNLASIKLLKDVEVNLVEDNHSFSLPLLVELVDPHPIPYDGFNGKFWVCRNALVPLVECNLQFTDFKQTLKDL